VNIAKHQEMPIDHYIDRVSKHLDPGTVIALAQHLVTTPSHTAEGEIEAAGVLEDFLQHSGVGTRRQLVGDAGVNVVAELPASGGEAGLLFNGHLDVVPPSSDMPFAPFSATIAEGRMWGRGTADMKGGLAAMACAMAAVKAANIPLVRPLSLAAVAVEEQGNLGTDALIRAGIRTRWAVVGEPTRLDLVIAHKGVDRYKVILEGRAAHESTPDLGVSAIIQACSIICGLRATLWPAAARQTHPLLGHATYNIGTIHGGTSRNMVPDRCVFQIAKRWVPGDSPAAIWAEIEAAVRAAEPTARASVEHEPEFDRIPHPPLDIPEDHPLVQTLAAVVERIVGRRPQLTCWGAFTDGALLQMAGVPTVVWGPGDIQQAHTDGEHIELDELTLAAQVYAAFAVVACATPDFRTLESN
jgi:acetylornithine deacetylase/succinyl-diaminopimelate desuccinylase family protein